MPFLNLNSNLFLWREDNDWFLFVLFYFFSFVGTNAPASSAQRIWSGRRWWWPELIEKNFTHIYDCVVDWFGLFSRSLVVVFNLVLNGDGPQSLFYVKWFFYRRLFCALFFIAAISKAIFITLTFQPNFFLAFRSTSIPFHSTSPTFWPRRTPILPHSLFYQSQLLNSLLCAHCTQVPPLHFERKIGLTSTNILRLFPFVCFFSPAFLFRFYSPSLLHFICSDERKNDGKIHQWLYIYFRVYLSVYIWHACVRVVISNLPAIQQ